MVFKTKNPFKMTLTWLFGISFILFYFIAQEGTIAGNIAEILYYPITLLGLFLLSIGTIGLLLILPAIFTYGFLFGWLMQKIFN